MRLAVLSDLHVGLGARAKDLCPVPPASARKSRDRYNRKDEASYRRVFTDFVRGRITADYLVLPGDLTNQATPEEVQLASDFVLEAADAMGVPHNHIVFAPGNHDVDWSVLNSPDSTGVRWGQRYDPIGHKHFVFKTLIDAGAGNVLAPPHFSAWDFPDLLAIAYNSASHDTPMPKEDAHHGLADPAHLAAIRAFIDGLGPPTDRVRLFLVHHHLMDFADPIPATPDFSLMTNSAGLLTLLHECHFDIIIHGHTHHPRFEAHSTETYPHLPILCSGSFSVELDTRWAGTVENLFHIISVDGRSGPDNLIKGTVTSWANNRARGWIPSEDTTSGIHHCIPFGSYVMPAALDALLTPFVRDYIATHEHVRWQHVVDRFPELTHLPLKSAEAAFTRLAAELDCDKYPATAMHGLMLTKKV